MANKDYYKVLGASEGTSLEELKKAYRTLALRHHPDRVPEKDKKKAEERFKEISEAYYVLSDPERRKKYDELRVQREAPGRGFAYQSGFDFEELLRQFGQGTGGRRRHSAKYTFFDDLSDIFGDASGGYHFSFSHGANRPEPEAVEDSFRSDAHAQLRIPRRLAEHGGAAEFTLNGGKRITLNIKKGTRDGQKLRLKDQGHDCPTCRHKGDLILTIRVGS